MNIRTLSPLYRKRHGRTHPGMDNVNYSVASQQVILGTGPRRASTQDGRASSVRGQADHRARLSEHEYSNPDDEKEINSLHTASHDAASEHDYSDIDDCSDTHSGEYCYVNVGRTVHLDTSSKDSDSENPYANPRESGYIYSSPADSGLPEVSPREQGHFDTDSTDLENHNSNPRKSRHPDTHAHYNIGRPSTIRGNDEKTVCRARNTQSNEHWTDDDVIMVDNDLYSSSSPVKPEDRRVFALDEEVRDDDEEVIFEENESYGCLGDDASFDDELVEFEDNAVYERSPSCNFNYHM